jgi:hypothetical protein
MIAKMMGQSLWFVKGIQGLVLKTRTGIQFIAGHGQFG